jgi:hypothetical protein
MSEEAFVPFSFEHPQCLNNEQARLRMLLRGFGLSRGYVYQDKKHKPKSYQNTRPEYVVNLGTIRKHNDNCDAAFVLWRTTKQLEMCKRPVQMSMLIVIYRAFRPGA